MSGHHPRGPADSIYCGSSLGYNHARQSSDNSPSYCDDRAAQISVAEAIKHRRSRSGCYTCRSRRVKCDESRPTCDRCRKGKRECLYPEPPRQPRAGQQAKSVSEDVDSSEEDKQNYAANEEISSGQDTLRGDESDTPSLSYSNFKIHGESSSSRDTSSSLSPCETTESPPQSNVRKSRPPIRRLRSDLSPALRFYLDYQRNHMSCHHYGLTKDDRGFLHTYLINQALSNEALLYAVVAFAAYHHTVRRPRGMIQGFLGYYSKSLSLLRLSLQNRQKRTIADLLTMLQLAVLEEHLGDWVTLLNHQKAAFSIITSLFSPESLCQDESINKTVEWYIRFDLYASFISGSESGVGKEWFEAQHRFYARQVREFPHDLGYKYDERNACARVLAKDVSILFHRRGKAAISETEFNIEASALGRRFASWYRDLPPAILDPAKVIKDLPRALSPILVDKENPDSELVVYGADLWPTNHMLVHFWSVELMFNHHLALLQRRAPPTDIATLALKICQMFEAVELRDPEPGAVLGVQAASGMASVHLRKEPQLTMWFRRKQVLIETSGYVYPTTFRTKMSEAWGVDVTHWWLPDDEGYAPILRDIREYVEYRTMPARDRASEELRDMSGIFESLNLNTT